MHPLLLEIPIFGGIRIYTYGFLVALGFFIGISWIVHEGKLTKPKPIDSDFILDLSYYIILSALVGARVLYIITEWHRYTQNPIDMIKIWEGGLVFYGGLLGALPVGLWYTWKHKVSFLKIADTFIVGLCLGHSIGRLGCLMSGCCYGRLMPDFPWAIQFPDNPLSLAPANTPLFPSQLAESFLLFLLFLLLVFVRRHKTFNGQVFLVYLITYSIVRSILEMFRGDTVRGFIIPNILSTSQFISLCMMILAVGIYFYLRRKKEVEKL